MGNACRFIAPVAKIFCQGKGLDVGGGAWPLEGAQRHDQEDGGAYQLPDWQYDYIFSSHCLEHLANPITALTVWKEHLVSGGVLFLYLPHPDMEYWRPQNCLKHRHIWPPEAMAGIITDLGFQDIVYSERDMAWSFCVVGYKA